jgi:hypothetical protein
MEPWLMRIRAFALLACCYPGVADAQMFCRETASDEKYNIQVSVCVTDANRDLIAHVRNRDSRSKQVRFSDCVIDLTSIGGGRYRSGPVQLLVDKRRPTNRHVIAPRIPSSVATDFRNLNTKEILCIYFVKVLDESAGHHFEPSAQRS